MFKCFILRSPGPTDLTWEEQNPSDYFYRPVDMSAIEESLRKDKLDEKITELKEGIKEKKKELKILRDELKILQLKKSE